MSIDQRDNDAEITSENYLAAQLLEYLEELPSSIDGKFSSASNIQENEFATVDVVRHLSRQEDLPTALEEIMDAPYTNGIDELLDNAVEDGHLQRELKTIETPYCEERPVIYQLTDLSR